MSSAKESCTSIVAWRWGPSSRPGPTGTTDISMASVPSAAGTRSGRPTTRSQASVEARAFCTPGRSPSQMSGPHETGDENATITAAAVALTRRRTPSSRAAAGHAPGAEREPLLQEVEVVGVRVGAELRRLELVLDTEDRLAVVDERIQAPALVVLVALLVERRVEVGQQRAALAQVVLQQRRQTATVRLVREHHVVPQLVAPAEREPGSVRVAVDVVELDRVEALAFAHVEAPLHDRAQHRAAADVEPALPRPSV